VSTLIILRLHQEILDFCQWIAPQQREFDVRWRVFERIKAAVETLYADFGRMVRVDYFGSFRTAIFLPTSDIDVVVSTPMPPRTSRRHSPDAPPMRELADLLKSLRICREDNVQILDKAAVPIIKIVDRETDIKVDISFNQQYGVRTAELVNVSAAETVHTCESPCTELPREVSVSAIFGVHTQTISVTTRSQRSVQRWYQFVRSHSDDY
jgi:DNA polymerase sigma